MTRDQMLDALRQNVCSVEFTKVNGDKRLMECTLRGDMIPENHLPKTDANLTDGLDRTIDVIRAYDVRAAGWRSFRVENVTNFNG
jgi:hypothetical protein